jgi:hypothetical protein
MNSSERCGTCPDPDASEIQAIEISFAIPVFMTQDQQGRLIRLVDDIIDQPWNEPLEGVHWMAEVGAKPNWSQIDAALLEKPVDPNAPATGEPTFDDSVFSIGSCARGFVSEKERDQVLERRTKPKRELVQAEALAKLFYEAYGRNAPTPTFEDSMGLVHSATVIPWEGISEDHKDLMIAACKEIQVELDRIASEKWRRRRKKEDERVAALRAIFKWCDADDETPQGQCIFEIERLAKAALGIPEVG